MKFSSTLLVLASLLCSAVAFTPSTKAKSSMMKMTAENEDVSRRSAFAALSLLGVTTLAAEPSKAVKFEPTMSFGRLPVPVYGAADGMKVGNSYEGIKPKETETFVYLPW
eukprot:CAMPEP_0185748414 /NCGR_PEP_ID=MMETSP1174-20130828/7098_1 /TAXON_ID=35687 /ORGANISM="Dictyocha speculum, Strain CCMP1381" /LENGTH=109 /DNA_ID=CAMNT_0028424073 /DNA_START=136 /DNA_END=462 /DNA_ORIENTATION=+